MTIQFTNRKLPVYFVLTLIAGLMLGSLFSGVGILAPGNIAIAQGEAQADSMTDYICYSVTSDSAAQIPNSYSLTHINPLLEGIQQNIQIGEAQLFCTPVVKSEGPVIAEVFINEVEQNPAGDDVAQERIELFNASTEPIDVGGWTISSSAGTTGIQTGAVMGPRSLLIITCLSPCMNNENEVVTLRDADGNRVDSTPETGLTDTDDDDNCWARVPDGTGDFVFQTCTLGLPNQ